MDKPTANRADPLPTPHLPPLPLTPALTSLLDSARKVPLSDSNHALQIVALQARVWSADASGNACRPWYLLCLELYPRGKVVNTQLHSPVAVKPTPAQLFSFFLNHVAKPPPDEAAVRPTQVSFVDPAVTGVLRAHIQKLRVRVDTLTLADGALDFIKKYSEKLVTTDRATRSDSAERPGLLSAPRVDAPLVAPLLRAAVSLFSAAPWTRIPEHVALEIQLPSRSDKDPYRDRFYVTVLGSSDKDIRGFALMPSLDALRHKYRRSLAARAGATDGAVPPDPPAVHAADVLVCASCGRRVGETTESDMKFVNRCSGCKLLLYCDERCQKIDWRECHRHECKAAREDKEYVFKRPQWDWLSRELALLFLDPTAMPFDDLDAWDENSFEFVEDISPPLYPMPFVSVQNPDGISSRRDLPTAREIEFLTYTVKALIECDSPPPAEGIMHLADGVSISIAENLADTVPVP